MADMHSPNRNTDDFKMEFIVLFDFFSVIGWEHKEDHDGPVSLTQAFWALVCN